MNGNKDKRHWLFEIKVALVALAASVLYFGLTFTIKNKGILQSGSFNNIPPTLMPRIIAVLAIITSCAMLASAVSGYKKAEKGPEGEKAESLLSFLDKDKVVVIVLFVVYLVLMNLVGYVISTILMAMAVLTYIDRSHMIRNIIYSVAFPLVCYFVFNHVLQIWLPAGMLFG